MKMVLLLMWLVAIVGCAEDPGEVDLEPEVIDGYALGEDDARSDGHSAWVVRGPEVTIWVENAPRVEIREGDRVWIVGMRASKNIRGVMAWLANGFPLQARVVSARKIEVRMDDEEMARFLEGYRTYVTLYPDAGHYETYHLAMVFKPGFVSYEGSTRIFFSRWINPVVVGTDLRFRGRVHLRPGYELYEVVSGQDFPHLGHDGPASFRVDWTPQMLLDLVARADRAFRVVAAESHTHYDVKRAQAQIRLTQLQLFRNDPRATFRPPNCSSDVRECLLARELFDAETEKCGWAAQTLACQDALLMSTTSPQRFVSDLKEKIQAYYLSNPSWVEEAGRPALEEVLGRIEVERVGHVDQREDNEYWEYDPRFYTLYWHTDPIHPASAKLWYGVYDPGGMLVTIFDEN